MSDQEVSTLKLRSDGNTERLHKVLATSGFGSRRKLEERILQGEVQLNGAAAELGSVVKPGDRVEIDGKKLIIRAAPGRLGQVLMYHKPEGELCARTDPEGRPTVFERLPFLKGARWIAVGRLDFNTTGLLLFTTDGDLANLLMHPSSEMEREYVARAYVDDPDELPAIVERMREPIELEDGPAQFDQVELIGASAHNALFKISLSEGRNREVRRMFAALGMEVGRLKRTRYGPIELPKTLLRTNYETMSPEQATELAEAAGMETKGAQLIAEAEATMRRRERLAIEREKEQGGRRHGPLRPPQPQAVVDADEFSLGQGRPSDSDSPRGRRRPESRRHRPGSRGPRPATPGQRERAPSARKGAGRTAAGQRGPGRGDAQPGQRRGRGDAQPRGPSQGQRAPGKGPRGRKPAEFHGPMDYANGVSSIDDKPISEADDNRGNSIAAGETHLGNQNFQSDAWRPVWPPAGDDQPRPAHGRPRSKKRTAGKPRAGRPGDQANANPGNDNVGNNADGNSAGNANEGRSERSGRGRRRRGRPGGPQSNRGPADNSNRDESRLATPGNSPPADKSSSKPRQSASGDGEQAKKPARRRTRKPKAANDGGGGEES